MSLLPACLSAENYFENTSNLTWADLGKLPVPDFTNHDKGFYLQWLTEFRPFSYWYMDGHEDPFIPEEALLIIKHAGLIFSIKQKSEIRRSEEKDKDEKDMAIAELDDHRGDVGIGSNNLEHRDRHHHDWLTQR